MHVRVRSNFFESWNPATLPRARPGPVDPAVGFGCRSGVTLTLLIWWTGLTSLPAFTVYGEDDVRFVGAPIWQELHLGILISLAAAAGTPSHRPRAPVADLGGFGV